MLIRFLAVTIAFLTLSCNSDDNIIPLEDEAVSADTGFYALKVGNTWNYLGYKRDGVLADDLMLPDGVEYTVTITDTTIIDGVKYFKRNFSTIGNEAGTACYPENGETVDHVRDSLGYLVNSQGRILFSERILDDYLQYDNLWGDIFGVLEITEDEVDVPAGTFTCKLNTIYAVLDETGEITPGSNEEFYSNGIGLVKKNVSGVSNPVHTWEIRLASYSID